MISVRNVGIRFDRRAALFRQVSFEVPRERSAVIIGPSGSGKSVLLKLIAGLLVPGEGSIELGSKNVGMLFQKNALFDSLTAEENLMFPLKERKGIMGAEGRSRARALLEQVGLGQAASLYPDELSGGMQKRLGIARALIVEPEIILYDEPTAGLDPITSRTIAELIRESQKRGGTTVLAVTNDMHRAYQLGDEIYLLARGELRPGGPPETVKSTRDPWFRQFIYGLGQGPLSGAEPA